MKAPPELIAGESSVEVVFLDLESSHPTWTATVASVLDAGLVLARTPGSSEPELAEGTRLKLVTTQEDQAHEAEGVVAASSSAGVAIELTKDWSIVERRGFPRANACLPMRYQAIDEKTAKRVATAIRSKVTDRPSMRSTEVPFERNEMAVLNARLQKIEHTLALLTDMLMWAGTRQTPMTERELVLSAAGMSFEPDSIDELSPGTSVELEMLLPLRDPVRVRALGVVVRTTNGDQQHLRAAIKFTCIDDADLDEIGRYVFQLQRRRQATQIG